MENMRRSRVQGAIETILSTLEPYLPFLNAHNTDFIVCGHWENFVPRNISDEVLALSEEELATLPCVQLMKKEDKKTEIEKDEHEDDTSSSHCATESIRTKLVEPGHDSSATPSAGTLADLDSFKWPHCDLKSFLFAIKDCSLANLGLDTDLFELIDQLGSGQSDVVSIQHYMSEKKCHEVDVMSDVCARVARSCETKQVIDIGSGKGYLSSRLTLMYGLDVIGVDSQVWNTRFGGQRNEKLKKKWTGFVKEAQKKGQTVKLENQVKSRKSFDCAKCKNENAKCLSTDAVITSSADVNNSSNESPKVDAKEVCCGEVISGAMDHVAYTGNVNPGAMNETSQVGAKGTFNEEATSGAMDHVRTVAENLVESENKPEIALLTEKSGVYIPLTMYIEGSTNLRTLVENHLGFGGRPIVLTGLHTCGNLASSMLRIFVEDEFVGSICNVGCCYQHLEEEFFRNPYLSDDESSDVNPGFPMSDFLRQKKVQLGRNARMLAAQPVDRIAQGDMNSSRSLYWRAILQQILVDLTGANRKDWQVGKIIKKCSTFVEYVRKALKKLGMVEEDKKLSDEDIARYPQQFHDERKKVFAFFQLRACFGQIVEGLILLDRLLYLLEQPTISHAYLTRIFDPVKSPRCYAIIGIKEELNSLRNSIEKNLVL